MAEERIEIPLTPERLDPISSRRYSTGGVSISDVEEQILPHYLIASTNTCHEICKYGSRPATAEMGKHSTREKQVEGQTRIRKFPPVVTKAVVRPRPPSDRKVLVLNTPRIIKQEVNAPKVIKQEVNAPKVIKQEVNAPKIIKQEVNTPKIIKQEVNAPKVIKQEVNTPKIIKQEVKTAKHMISSLKKVDAVIKTKPAIASKPPVIAKSCSFSLKPSRAINNDVKIVKNAVSTSKIVQKKAVELPRAKASVSPKPSFTRSESFNTKQRTVKAAAAPLKNQKKEPKDETKPPNNEKVVEKTLYIIEPKPEEESLKPSDSHSSLSSLSSCSSLSSPLLLPSEGDTPKAELEKEDKGEDKDVSQKLDFWRAKEVTLESDDNDCRRLRFSTGRMLENKQNVQNDIKQISFTRREVSDDDVSTNDQSESEKVVLRRQDKEEKKDAQGLYNGVIEETASKLVEAKKSKVRALVGAFETVISLQESNKSFSYY